MKRNVFIGSAWPYVNGELHLGHIAALVPADFLARYHRLKGDNVLWTSGSDCHGTPITERARLEHCSPREIAERYHEHVVETFEKLGFSYSLYWATMEPNHAAGVQASFLELWEKGLIIENDFSLAHCDACKDNRADREINGECPVCHDKRARGDQCDACGRTSNPNELVNPTCAACGKTVSFTNTRELFLNLPKLAPELKAWVNAQTHWRENAKQLTKGWLEKGLEPRCITRDIEWGIPVPLAGWEHRRIYVWFEAVHGYLTASKEWAERSGKPDAWKPFWEAQGNVLAYYVIGKDNIPFHTLIWPFMLMGRDLALPWHIVSSEYLGLEGKQFSTSRNWAIWAPDFLSRYEPDLIRYYLTINGPEKNDTDFTWEQFVSRVNGELIDNYGNLVHRVLSFIENKFGGEIPEDREYRDRDRELMDFTQHTFNKVGTLIEQTEFRQAMEAILSLVQATNRYVQSEEPWKTLKIEPSRAKTVLRVALSVIESLSILTEPFLPFQAEKLRVMLDVTTVNGWAPPIRFENRLGTVTPLFKKLDPILIEEEQARLNAQSTP